MPKNIKTIREAVIIKQEAERDRVMPKNIKIKAWAVIAKKEPRMNWWKGRPEIYPTRKEAREDCGSYDKIVKVEIKILK